MKIIISSNERYPDYNFSIIENFDSDAIASKKYLVEVNDDKIKEWEKINNLYSNMQVELKKLYNN